MRLYHGFTGVYPGSEAEALLRWLPYHTDGDVQGVPHRDEMIVTTNNLEEVAYALGQRQEFGVYLDQGITPDLVKTSNLKLGGSTIDKWPYKVVLPNGTVIYRFNAVDVQGCDQLWTGFAGEGNLEIAAWPGQITKLHWFSWGKNDPIPANRVPQVSDKIVAGRRAKKDAEGNIWLRR